MPNPLDNIPNSPSGTQTELVRVWGSSQSCQRTVGGAKLDANCPPRANNLVRGAVWFDHKDRCSLPVAPETPGFAHTLPM